MTLAMMLAHLTVHQCCSVTSHILLTFWHAFSQQPTVPDLHKLTLGLSCITSPTSVLWRTPEWHI